MHEEKTKKWNSLMLRYRKGIDEEKRQKRGYEEREQDMW